jgi:hypothetical protein
MQNPRRVFGAPPFSRGFGQTCWFCVVALRLKIFNFFFVKKKKKIQAKKKTMRCCKPDSVFVASKQDNVEKLKAILKRNPEAATIRNRQGHVALHYAKSVEAQQLLCQNLFFPHNDDEETEEFTMV